MYSVLVYVEKDSYSPIKINEFIFHRTLESSFTQEIYWTLIVRVGAYIYEVAATAKELLDLSYLFKKYGKFKYFLVLQFEVL